MLPQYDLKAEPQIGFFEWDLIKDTFKVSKHIVELLAFKTNSVVKTYSEWRELTHPYDIIQTREYMDSVINSKTPYVNLEIRKISRDGTWRYFRVSGIVTKFNKQRSVKISGTIWDVSDIKNTMLEFQKTKNLTGAIKNIIKINKDALSTDDKYLEIIRIFNEATNPKNIMLAFSLKSKPNELNKNSIFTNDSIVDATQIFPEKLNFINALFNTKKHIINNDNNTCLLGIHLDLPFQRQGKIILERSEPFDDDYLEFLAPLIDTIEHVVNINELESSHSELDNVISFFIRQVPAPVAMFDTHMRHRFVSDAWKIMHNLSDDPSEYIGKRIRKYIPTSLWNGKSSTCARSQAKQ